MDRDPDTLTRTTGLNPQERQRFYADELLRLAPRLLSALDRCPLSASGGSLDREYWAWASKDFANQDLQRGLLVLAYLHRTPLPGNFLHGQAALLSWIESGVEFWLKSQDRWGAFDHLYPFESSWMAAAFTLLDLGETYRLLGRDVRPDLAARWMQGMVKAGRFLCAHDETHGFISNHRAGAAAALANLSDLCGEQIYLERAWELMEGVYRRQSDEGWFLEYEGADPGYQTLDTHYQAWFHLRARRPDRTQERVSASLEFLSHFMHPDGSLGGEYGSRNCPHFFPGGLEHFAALDPRAEALAAQGASGLKSGASCGLADADARNEVPLATSYVLALMALENDAPRSTAPLPWQGEMERLWSGAGMYVRSTADRYLILGAAKGGVIKVFAKAPPGLLHSSCGYAARLPKGREATTLLWNPDHGLEADPPLPPGPQPLLQRRTLRLRAPFHRFRSDRLMSPLKLLLFRLFMLTAGRWRPLSDWVRRNLIVGRFLTRRQRVGLSLTRVLRVEGRVASLADTLAAEPGTEVLSLREHGFFSSVYMASARYFRTQDLIHAWSGEELAGRLEKENPLNLERRVP